MNSNRQIVGTSSSSTWCSSSVIFVAGAVLGEAQLSLFVAGAVLGQAQVTLLKWQVPCSSGWRFTHALVIGAFFTGTVLRLAGLPDLPMPCRRTSIKDLVRPHSPPPI